VQDTYAHIVLWMVVISEAMKVISQAVPDMASMLKLVHFT